MAELYAVKGNKHLQITEAERAAHLVLGYDIARVVDGKRLEIIETSPAKTVPFPKYKAALDKVAALEAALAKASGGSKALEKVRAENKALRAELTALRKKKEGGK
jgi:hypothetical protein